MKEKTGRIISISLILGGVLFYSLVGFTVYGKYPVFVSYEGTLQGDIADWIWDDKPWETSFREVAFFSLLLVLCVTSIFIIFYLSEWLYDKQKIKEV